MTWIRVDDDFADHPKVMALEGERLRGLGLWHVAASYCARYLTDGYVPAAHLKANAPASLIDRMVKVGLFDKSGGGYILHDWLDYNPPKGKVLAEREAARKRMFGKRSGEVQPNAERTDGDLPQNLINPVPVPHPVPVSEVLPNVSSNGSDWVDPADLYRRRANRKALSKKEQDWLEDLYVRFSRTELVKALAAVTPGSDYLKRVDAFLEGVA